MGQEEALKCSHLSAPDSGLASSAKITESLTQPRGGGEGQGGDALLCVSWGNQDIGPEPESYIQDGLPVFCCFYVLSFQLS